MSDETKKKKKLVIDDKVWLLLSLCAAFLVWYLLSIGKTTGRSFPFADKVVPSVKTMIDRGAFWKDIGSSMLCVVAGFGLGFITSLPIAFLMAWYQPVQKIIEPWINFIRNIPALGYAPLLVLIFGIGQKPAIILIWICTFMTMSITIYQGIKNIDVTLIKAARVLGANDFDIFMKIICPATVPFIITAVRLGLGAALTTLLAAESTGAQFGIGINGHVAFNEADDTLSVEEFKNLHTRVLAISKETRTANAIGDLNGAIDDMPQFCITIGMNEIYHARKVRLGCFRDWHRSVVRHAAYGEVSAHFPVTLLQNHPDMLLRVTEFVAKLPEELCV